MSNKITIIGLGYVGLPLLYVFSKKNKVVGFDVSITRITELKKSYDRTGELTKGQLDEIRQNGAVFSNHIDDIRDSQYYIITVPTPIDKYNKPDISFLIAASTTVGEVLKKKDIVIYESTVYPGCTEEDCVPVLEKVSGLKYNIDFFCGYSPERINPGDKNRTLTKILKITSGSNPETSEMVDNLYKSVISAGTYRAPSIKVAEAAKVIENTQRDVNISFINELALIFDKMGIDTTEVLKAASTKWNFISLKPGLVGGHCIGVDPFYLTHKAEQMGHNPQVIHSGRFVNDQMGVFIANKVVKLMLENDLRIKSAHVLVLGITFKENCSDIRNTGVMTVVRELETFGVKVSVYDPYAIKEEVTAYYGVELLETLTEKYEAIILTVAHREFIDLDYGKLKSSNMTVIYDVKSILPKDLVTARL